MIVFLTQRGMLIHEYDYKDVQLCYDLGSVVLQTVAQ